MAQKRDSTEQAEKGHLWELAGSVSRPAPLGLAHFEKELVRVGTFTHPEKGFTVDFVKGPIHLDLGPEDKAEFLESKSPPAEFQAFTQAMIQAALKGLDIPYSFYDESHTNYSGQRQAWLQYELSAEGKRKSLRRLLDRLTRWRLQKAILEGTVELPEEMTLSDLTWEWIARGVPWIDPLKEVRAEIYALGAGLVSRSELCKRRGRDFYEVARQLAEENEYLVSLGLPTNISSEAPNIRAIKPKKEGE